MYFGHELFEVPLYVADTVPSALKTQQPLKGGCNHHCTEGRMEAVRSRRPVHTEGGPRVTGTKAGRHGDLSSLSIMSTATSSRQMRVVDAFP